MYVPEHFQEQDVDAVRQIVVDAPLCTLIAQASSGLIVNHLPVQLEGERLIGHIARANELHRLLEPTSPVVAVFQAGDTYVSPSWYPSKARHHRHVPTWNYRVAHLHGHIQFLHEERAKRSVVARLTRTHEEATNGAKAWHMSDAPPDYIEDMLREIVAFEMVVTRAQAKVKLSQNRSAEDVAGVARALDARGESALAADIRARHRVARSHSSED